VVSKEKSLFSKAVLVLVFGGAITSLFLLCALLVARIRPSTVAWANSFLHYVDLFSLNHKLEPNEIPVKKSTTLGGIFSLLALTVIATYSAYMVQSWLDDNTLVQQSLYTLEEETWGLVKGLPWASNIAQGFTGLSPAPPPSSLLLQIQVDGDPGACAAPLTWSQAGLREGSWRLSTAPAACGAAKSVATHFLTCPACIFTSSAQVQLTWHYSCQAFLLTATGAQPYPSPKTSIFTAPVGLTRAAAPPAPAGLLQTLTWTIAPVLSVLWDNITQANSQGWMLSWQDLEVGPLQALASGDGGLLLQPAASSVTLTIALPLADTYHVTLLTPKVPWTALIANIVGLSGLIGMVGILFSHCEMRLSLFRARGVNINELKSSPEDKEGKAPAPAAAPAAAAGLTTRALSANEGPLLQQQGEAPPQWHQPNPLFFNPAASAHSAHAHSTHWDIPSSLSARALLAEKAGCTLQVLNSAAEALDRDELPPGITFHVQEDGTAVFSLPDGSLIPDPRDHFEDYLTLWTGGRLRA